MASRSLVDRGSQSSLLRDDRRERLRIAVIAPPWFEIPPSGYGGIEALCHWLTEGLVAQGHDVTLVAAGRDATTARFVRTYETPPTERLGEALPEVTHAGLAFASLRDLGPFDVVHDHTLVGPLLAHAWEAPVVVTAHGPVDGELGTYYSTLPPNAHLVAISNAQRNNNPDLRWAETIHNGIPVGDYPFVEDKDDFALFLGRMSPEKAPHLAIEACRAAGIDLVIAAKCNEPREHEYYEAKMRPLLGPGVEYVGEVADQDKKELLGKARCLVFPIQWEEPFGIVMVEAMACGTPVVALPGGSVTEVVADGESGFVCPDLDQLAESIKRADVIDPRACRRRAELFDVSGMVAGYEDLFARLSMKRDTGSAEIGMRVSG